VLGFCSWLVDALPLAEVLPDVLLWASELGFCSWLIDGVEPACDSCFFSCATAPNVSNAAATATAIGLNLMRSPFLGTPIGDCPEKASKLRAVRCLSQFAVAAALHHAVAASARC
jgi:hypothetical protein